jgi:membrane protein implicated in regulation of membrane protease activity
MDSWLLWLIAAVLLGVGEIVTLSFFLAPFAGGALLAALASAAGLGAVITWGIFVVASAGLLIALRPIARAHNASSGKQLKTGTAALVGRSATVVERIANGEGVGSVRLEGEIWTARSYFDDEVLEPGTSVQVMEIRGATALVSQ